MVAAGSGAGAAAPSAVGSCAGTAIWIGGTEKIDGVVAPRHRSTTGSSSARDV